MELGQTQSAMALIPGSVSNARFGATEWARTAGKALETRDAFAKLDDAGTWTGAAYDRYLERFRTQLAYWQHTSDVFTSAANALGNYANALEWAQAEAARAIELWDAAEAQAAAALVQHEEHVRELRRGHGLRHVDADVPFVDPSGPAHQEAREVLANARYQLDVLATGYANTIGEASNAALLPLTPQQAQQAAIDAAVYLTVDMSVVQPFVSTLNFLGGILETVLEHPDIVFEILGGILGIAGGVATIVGGGGLELVTAGVASPIAVPAVIAGGAVAAGGAGMVGHGIDRWMNEVTTDPDRRPGMDRGDGRDYKGNFTSRDPDAPPRDYEDAEKNGLDKLEERFNVTVIRDKVRIDYPGAPQNGRYYDGLIRNPDGTYTGVEVKFGSEYDKYFREGYVQREFDEGLLNNPAVGTLNGEEIRVTAVRVIRGTIA